MKKSLLIFCIASSIHDPAAAQSTNSDFVSAFFRQAANGPRQRSVTDVIGNPVVLEPDAVFRYGLLGSIPYGVGELFSFTGFLQVADKNKSGGVVLHNTGTNSFQYRYGKCWLSGKISSNMAMGVSMNVHHMALQRRQNYFRLSGSVGFKLKIAEHVQCGLLIEDLNELMKPVSKSGSGFLQYGLSLSLTEQCSINFDIIKEKSGNPYLTAALSYCFPSQFYSVIGYDTGKETASFLFSCRAGKVTVTTGIKYHAYLGYTSQILLSNDMNVIK